MSPPHVPFPAPPPDGVTEQHVHLGGSVSIDRLWEMGQMHGIRGLGSYEQLGWAKAQRCPTMRNRVVRQACLDRNEVESKGSSQAPR